MIPSDHRERQRALCTTTSFCVSAPAGSGKTSLLVKRFLKLLSATDAPESIVAITFTRKAAAEMRARILEALQEAMLSRPLSGDHERELRDLANAVLAQNERRGWDLLRNPTRLRLQTIDSFCAELTRPMPVLSGVGGSLTTSDDASHLYRQAVHNFLERESIASDRGRRDDIQRLLLHLDND